MTSRRRWSVRLLADECGGSLAPVLVVLAIGVLLMSPFLAHVSTRMLASRGADAETLARYAADLGVEWGAWSLLNNSGFRATVDATPLTPVALTPAISLNGLTVNSWVTAVLVRGWDSSSLAGLPDDVDKGGNLAATGGDFIYAFRGKSKEFWRYSVSVNQWVARADVPTKPDNGSALGVRRS